MNVYREVDGDITREYIYDTGNQYLSTRTKKQLVQLVPTKEFGYALFIDNELQFTEKDEYIYHESLIHPCLAHCFHTGKILVLGGGDGCAVREILKWQGHVAIDTITVLDWDKELVDLFRTDYAFLNKHSFASPNVHLDHRDVSLIDDVEKAWYDCIVVDLLDPRFGSENDTSFWKKTIELCKQWLLPYGSLVINAGGYYPWTVQEIQPLLFLLQEAFPTLKHHLYKVFVPSFGREWYFILLNLSPQLQLPFLPPQLRWLSKFTWKSMYSTGWPKEHFTNLNLNISHQLEEDDD